MKYTVRFAHLSKLFVKEGDIVSAGDLIGAMGHTGYTEPSGVAGTHLHIDVVEGERKSKWLLSDMGRNNPAPNQLQLSHFAYTGQKLAKDLLKDPAGKSWIGAKITNGWLGYENHYAYDIIGEGYHHKQVQVFWNRSFKGKVIAAKYSENTGGYDPSGYGNYVHILFDTEEAGKKETVPEKSETLKSKKIKLVGTVPLYNEAGVQYPVPSTITKTVEVTGEKEGFYQVFDPNFSPSTVYVKKSAVEETTSNLTYLYEVQPGDTLSGISNELNISVEELVEENKIQDPNKIYAGQKLKIK